MVIRQERGNTTQYTANTVQHNNNHLTVVTPNAQTTI